MLAHGRPAGPSEVQMLGGGEVGTGRRLARQGCVSHSYISSLCVPTGSAPTTSPACTPSGSVTGSEGIPRPAATLTLHPAPAAPPPAALNKALLQTPTRLLSCRASAPTFPCVPPTASHALSRHHPRGPVPVPRRDPCHGLGSSVAAPACPTVLPRDPRLARRSRTPLSLARWLAARLPPG